jgi:hypothetical protein
MAFQGVSVAALVFIAPLLLLVMTDVFRIRSAFNPAMLR